MSMRLLPSPSFLLFPIAAMRCAFVEAQTAWTVYNCRTLEYARERKTTGKRIADEGGAPLDNYCQSPLSKDCKNPPVEKCVECGKAVCKDAVHDTTLKHAFCSYECRVSWGPDGGLKHYTDTTRHKSGRG